MASLIEQFVKEAAAVHSTVHVISTENLNQTLSELIAYAAPGTVHNGLVEKMISRDELAEKLIGVSKMVAGIAETGSLIVDLSSPDHLVSLLPTHHIAILNEKDIYPSLADYFKRKEAPLRFTQITGPSKTADIEKILVYGAHGPVRLDIIIIQNQ